ncbi:alpha/beta hydrolase-fold protein [Niveispirillum sp.]|uniref:alpha/beta hydrolase n=1 Tax=Niveispirillum sp. TaxID=1917217 RepID=UPI001B7100F1|nr:alpha/beta hydrolase-fold protein [Niveispirillum sp.]MBP7336581.1 alpha/beta hydrolase [Niveispirillum sp.]
MNKLLKTLLLAACLLAPSPVVAGDIPGLGASEPIQFGTSYMLESKVLDERRRLNVLLPASYAEGDRRYPVLYLIDGGVKEDWFHIAGLVQLGELNGVTQEVILVGIEGTDRKRDLTSPSQDPLDVKELPTHGGADKFRHFLADELKPYIDKNFRTAPETGVIGESLAGLFILETFLRQPDLFTHYIAISPSLWWNKEALSYQAADLLKAQKPGTRSLHLAIGNEGGGMRGGLDRVMAALKANPPAGLTWDFQDMAGERHHSIYHPAALPALRAAFPGPNPIK